MLLDDVAVARAATGRGDDCRPTFDMSVVSDGEAAINRLSDSHNFEEVGCLFKCNLLQFLLLSFVVELFSCASVARYFS